MLIFREVEELVHATKERIAVLGTESDPTLEEQRLELLLRMVSYINGFSWLRHQAIIDKVKTFLRCRYSYDAVIENYGVSQKQAHKAISYAGEQLRERIGSIMVLIRESRLEAAKRELDIVTGVVDSSSLFIGDITDEFSPEKDDSVVLGANCQRELSFLAALSRKRFDSIVAALDARRLKHILYVLLSTDKTFLHEKELLWKCVIDGSLTVNDCIRLLNEEYIYSPLNYSGGSEL